MYKTLLGVTMIKQLLPALAFGCVFWACEQSTAPQKASNNKTTVTAVDYSLGRAMNQRLGRGINLGNSWDSDGYDDSGWSNPIRDQDFAIIKAAGFNSVRIPVRWQNYSDYTTHTVDPERLKGVMEDIQLALANNLAVVVNFHHYTQLNCAGGGGTDEYGEKCEYNEAKFASEKAHFLGMWAQVATAMNAFPDSLVVLEILNEPTIPSATVVDHLMNEAYTVIRAAAPGKTIMFESYHAAKFADLSILHLPKDGNIIFSGHYYEPYGYTHQGHGYNCIGDNAKGSNAKSDMASYVGLAYQLYPDVDGFHEIPLNMGEFGVSGGDPAYCNGQAPSNEGKAEWAKLAVEAATSHGMSFHYWGFAKTGGFDAYNIDKDVWYPGFPDALLK